jgi:hypothetical protein
MTRPCRESIVLCLSLVSAVASAQEHTDIDWEEAEQQFEAFRRTAERPEPGEPLCLPQNTNRVHKTRRLTLYSDAADKVLEVYVSGGVATIIRLPAKLAARGTRIGAGGERRFKLLMGGDQILITPTRHLAKGERFPFLVVLADGTVIPLSLTRAPEGARPDGELWLDREKANPEQLRIRLAAMTERAKGFEASYRQALKEQESEDFQLAGMMAGGSRLTAFDRARVREFMASAVGAVTLTTYAPRSDAESATNRVVAVFRITHQGTEPLGPLNLSFGRAVQDRGGDFAPPVVRAQPSVIPPGGEGQIAVVLDRASFDSDGTVTLTFSDKDQVVQLSADLSLEDFRAPARSGSWWWPF